ncbi:hypothetical protein AN640_05075 [Candidatus Epulonipiscium fishelsonii]|uniref:Uncharacterized protein n=1 Tax=Candidatus Epulonipiscium fishelsonii TaxID=77094 RepID=A0ACC8XIC0_9FIRM|nr:hypothetical protein AN640_05075 [Epulopiscium sp. SCG-D08WGA-EpuloA1]OON90479.1 MAG: hypothetical protein ATN32_03835 [Epulopiscium sp. AS2M-Bin002]
MLDFNVEQDLEQILKLIAEYMYNKYISEVEEEILNYQNTTKEPLPNEAQLIQAIAPFTSEENSKALMEIVEVFKYNQIIEHMLPKILPKTGANSEQDILTNIVTRMLLYKIIQNM